MPLIFSLKVKTFIHTIPVIDGLEVMIYEVSIINYKLEYN